MGIKTYSNPRLSLAHNTSEKPPHHMGIKTHHFYAKRKQSASEKPPHHMGIKTGIYCEGYSHLSLKNLPTTWGLRHRLCSR